MKIDAQTDEAASLVISGATSEVRQERARMIGFMRFLLSDFREPEYLAVFADDLDERDLWSIANRIFSGLAKAIARGDHEFIRTLETEVIDAPKGSA